MAKSTKLKKGDFAVQINSPTNACLVQILEEIRGKDGEFYSHKHLNVVGLPGPHQETGVVHVKFLRRATKKEILIHAVRKEY